ncbi:MAG: helix-hairpin-helix domain-containing protein [Haloferacaceae archaeon]
MTILDKLLSAIGLGSSDDRGDREPTVTVEHEPDASDGTVEHEPDASDEAAVKGVDPTASEATGTDTAAESDEPDTGTESAAESAAETATESADAASESVDTVKGIGPAYAERLGGAGVETIADLAAADAADLAERTSLSEKRLGRWIERARARRD